MEGGEANREREVRRGDGRGRQTDICTGYRATERAVVVLIILLPEISLK